MPRHSPCSIRPGSGFTLLEVVVALAVSGIVLLSAHSLSTGLALQADRIAHAAADADRDANAERFLRDLLAALEVATDSTRTFEGDARWMRFATWCSTPAGWQERCDAVLALDSRGGSHTLVAVLSTGEIIPIRSGFTRGAFLYLRDAAHGGTWMRVWGRSMTAPVAVGLVFDGDTLILRIGERG